MDFFKCSKKMKTKKQISNAARRSKQRNTLQMQQEDETKKQISNAARR
jgi:hypothetical protein